MMRRRGESGDEDAAANLSAAAGAVHSPHIDRPKTHRRTSDLPYDLPLSLSSATRRLSAHPARPATDFSCLSARRVHISADTSTAATLAAPGVWRVTTPLPFRPRSVHAYLLDAGEGWVLVDGGLGTDEAWAALDAGVREAAGGWEAVAVHVVTHMHMDHVGLSRRVRDASGARC
jgi:hypothetical protein